jgi:hypothetical protein
MARGRANGGGNWHLTTIDVVESKSVQVFSWLTCNFVHRLVTLGVRDVQGQRSLGEHVKGQGNVRTAPVNVQGASERWASNLI